MPKIPRTLSHLFLPFIGGLREEEGHFPATVTTTTREGSSSSFSSSRESLVRCGTQQTLQHPIVPTPHVSKRDSKYAYALYVPILVLSRHSETGKRTFIILEYIALVIGRGERGALFLLPRTAKLALLFLHRDKEESFWQWVNLFSEAEGERGASRLDL